MERWIKWLVATALLPACLGASQALFWVFREVDHRQGLAHYMAGSGQLGPVVTWVPLLAGAACWWVVYLMLPRPMWLYVFGHEITHVLWAWLFRGQVKRFKVTPRGGHVVLTRVNFLITLAPYFFPFYAILVVLAYGLACLFGEGQRYWTVFLLVLGAAYGFHVTLTWHALQTEQTDITSQGYFFSAVVIWLGNVAFLILALCWLLEIPLADAAREFRSGTWEVLRGVARLLGLPR